MVSASGKQDSRDFDLFMNLSIVLIATGVCLLLTYWKVGLLILVFASITYFSLYRSSCPPINNPSEFLRTCRRGRSPIRPVLVCIGDSLTHGQLSANFTTEIAGRVRRALQFKDTTSSERPGDCFEDPVWVVNAGQNSLTSHVVLQERLPYALACFPDYVILMIGTNDVMCMCSPLYCGEKMSTWNLPEPPSMAAYKRNMDKILDFITQSSPKTTIGVCTLPPLGENLNSTANDLIQKANAIIQTLVSEKYSERCSVVDVYEALANVISRDLSSSSVQEFSVTYGVALAIMISPFRQLFGIPWNTFSSLLSLSVTTDTIHLNENARDLIADTISQWLFKKNVHKAIAVKQF